MRIGELGTRLDPELLVEAATKPTVEGERGALPAAACQRDHQPGVRPLVQRFATGQRLQLTERPAVLAGGRGGLGVLGHRFGPQQVEPDDCRMLPE